MIEYGLKKAAAISFAAHFVLIIATFFTIGRTASFQMPSPYTVRLVSPDASSVKALRVPPTKAKIPPAKDEVPAADEMTSKSMKLPPEKTTPLKDYSEDKIAALRAKKELEQHKAERLQALQAKQKLAKVKEIGEAKAGVTITAESSGEQGEGSIVGEYYQQVRSLIEQEWILAGSDHEGLYAIITVKVFRNGALKVAGIERSSNNALFDRAALRAIAKASPVPPPPFEMELGVRFIPLNE